MFFLCFVAPICCSLWECTVGATVVEISASADTVDVSKCLKTIKNLTFQAESQISVLPLFSGSSLQHADLTNCVLLNEIGPKCFSYSELISILFPSQLKVISSYSFQNCYFLKQASLSGLNITYLGIEAFRSSKITTMDLGSSSLETIEESAFLHCYSMSRFSLPSTIKKISSQAFLSTKFNISDLTFMVDLRIIGSSALSGCPMTEIILPESVLEIHSRAFFGISNNPNSYFTIPKNVRLLGEQFWPAQIIGFRFSDDSTMTDFFSIESDMLFNRNKTMLIGFPPSKPTFEFTSTQVVVIGNLAFSSAYPLSSVDLSGLTSLRTIGEMAFYATNYLNTVKFPKSLTAIFSKVFDSTSLLSIDFNDCRLQYIGESAFQSTYSVNLTLPYVTKLVIETNAFSMNSQLQTIHFNIDDLTLHDSAFYFCTMLTSVQFNTSKLTIGNEVFKYNSLLVGTFVLPSSLIKIGRGVFSDTKINGFEIGAESALFSCVDGFLFNKNGSKLLQAPPEFTSYACTSLALTMVGEYAFCYTKSGKIDLSACENLKIIGKFAFWEAKINEGPIILPNNLEEIHDSAFKRIQCSNLTFVIPKSLKFIGNDPIEDSSMKSYSFEEPNPTFSVYYEFLTNPDQTEIISCFSANSFGGDYSSITTIGSYAFANKYLNALDLSIFSGLKTIKPYAFYGATLLSLNFPDSLTEILDHAFEYSTFHDNIMEIVIPASLQFFGYKAFRTSNGFPGFSVKTGSTKFSSYKEILYNYDRSELICAPSFFYGGVGFAAEIETIKKYAFEGTGLSYIDLGGNHKLKKIEEYAFTNSYLESIVLPPSLEYIGDFAFRECNLLTMMSAIPKSVSYIGINPWLNAPINKLEFEPDSSHFISQNQILITKQNPTIISCPSLNSANFTGSNDIANIGTRAFSGCIMMDVIDLSETKITSFADETFRNASCKLLKLPCTLKTIGESCFEEAVISIIYVPNSVVKIGKNAFSNSKSLEFLRLPPNLGSIEEGLCSKCFFIHYLIPPTTEFVVNGENSFLGCNLLCGINSGEKQKEELIKGGIGEQSFEACAVPDYSEEYFCLTPPTYEFSTFEVDNPYLDDIVTIILYSWSLAKFE